ncbi:conserved Plasmodium protein, unknown function [Plasmodium malariae]|uniref:G-patch domain-containing protein n=1 Tax=Plasmodium malariae TaxID=5858 RepID=A0A1D3PCB9_PLAMA|nr:conserved Plasmodium protein, unknown function [Plasmodium malariae]SCN12625.1 conserved Plasmodium protein, unknown function [Plasmodium malariae]
MSKKYYEKLLGDIQNQSKPVESKFGYYILQKFGWEKGKGLGKHENGDVSIMKIKKYGEHGLGYEESKENDKNGMWWENMYNNCAKKIASSVSDLYSSSKTNGYSANGICENKIEKEKNENVKYSIFVKKSSTVVNTEYEKLSSLESEEKKNWSISYKEKKHVKIREKEICKKEKVERTNIDDSLDIKRKITEEKAKNGDDKEIAGVKKKKAERNKKGKRKNKKMKKKEKKMKKKKKQRE